MPVRAVLVVLTGTVIPQVTIKQMPDDVVLLDRIDVPGVFKRVPKRLTEEQVAAVYEQARRSILWSAAQLVCSVAEQEGSLVSLAAD